LKIKNCKLERAENFKYLGVTLNEDNNSQIDFANKTYFTPQKFFKNKNT